MELGDVVVVVVVVVLTSRLLKEGFQSGGNVGSVSDLLISVLIFKRWVSGLLLAIQCCL